MPCRGRASSNTPENVFSQTSQQAQRRFTVLVSMAADLQVGGDEAAGLAQDGAAALGNLLQGGVLALQLRHALQRTPLQPACIVSPALTSARSSMTACALPIRPLS